MRRKQGWYHNPNACQMCKDDNPNTHPGYRNNEWNTGPGFKDDISLSWVAGMINQALVEDDKSNTRRGW